MRIPRTNFNPAAFHEGPFLDDPEFDGRNEDVQVPVEEDTSWYHTKSDTVEDDVPHHAPVEEPRPRFRSPLLRSYDPVAQADGTWESHFYMAPNVRFTRTPDRNPVARQAKAEAVEHIEEIAAVPNAAPEPHSDSVLLQNLRDALDERRKRFETPARVSSADMEARLEQRHRHAPVTAPPVVAAVRPVKFAAQRPAVNIPDTDPVAMTPIADSRLTYI